jgi:BirA family biotin operon repressor/biotin-[acetyl-CoA-carboxylase] ligase
MKAKILHMLRQSTSPVSGEKLSATLGVSRVSVWKHIRALQQAGYGINASSTGYLLEHDSDTPYAWEFPGRESRIHYHERISSTMDEALALARNGCPAFSVVVAERQVQGRGRLDRSWASQMGGLYFTIVTRPAVTLNDGARVLFTASLTLTETLNRRFEINAGVKWPNDILVGERKLAGLLSQVEAEGEQIRFLNIGIGLNVNNDPGRNVPTAVSLCKLVGRALQRRRILADFLEAFEKSLSQPNLNGVVARWKAACVTLGRDVEIIYRDRRHRGIAIDIDAAGGLILQKADGSRETLHFGDCFHR